MVREVWVWILITAGFFLGRVPGMTVQIVVSGVLVGLILGTILCEEEE